MPKTRMDWFKLICRTILVIIGTIIVAVGNIAFLVPLDINAGGLSGIGIIARYFADPSFKTMIYNIIVTGASVILWLVGLLFIGKDFAVKTLVATIVFPAANWILTTVPGISNAMANFGELIKTSGNGPTAGNYLLAGLFGGVFVGTGVSITFVGGGSTGGVDVITFLFEKYLKIKQSIASFLVDGTIVVLGLLLLLPRDNSFLLPCLSGILSAFVTALIIEVIFIGSQTSYQVDIISEKWEEISKFAQDEMGRGATIIPAKGGYRGENRPILRIVFDKRQYNKIRVFISKVDPKAFVTFTRTNAVFGEGFKAHIEENTISQEIKKRKKK
ncbi:MAG: YitT family protein [Bacilli bacterium]|nr:YitT family protein [Bacilli bacterium]